jgi:hypothetical protein
MIIVSLEQEPIRVSETMPTASVGSSPLFVLLLLCVNPPRRAPAAGLEPDRGGVQVRAVRGELRGRAGAAPAGHPDGHRVGVGPVRRHRGRPGGGGPGGAGGRGVRRRRGGRVRGRRRVRGQAARVQRRTSRGASRTAPRRWRAP